MIHLQIVDEKGRILDLDMGPQESFGSMMARLDQVRRMSLRHANKSDRYLWPVTYVYMGVDLLNNKTPRDVGMEINTKRRYTVYIIRSRTVSVCFVLVHSRLDDVGGRISLRGNPPKRCFDMDIHAPIGRAWTRMKYRGQRRKKLMYLFNTHTQTAGREGLGMGFGEVFLNDTPALLGMMPGIRHMIILRKAGDPGRDYRPEDEKWGDKTRWRDRLIIAEPISIDDESDDEIENVF